MARNKGLLDSLTPVQRAVAAVLVVVIGGAVALWKARQQPAPVPTPAPPGEVQTLANRNVRFGFPAPAKADPASRDAYLIERPQYVLSYNDTKKIPNWVCWNLTAGDLGKADRTNAWGEDPDLPPGFRRVTYGTYSGSGFDRGHLCPSADRTDSADNNKLTFLMTNIMPQSAECNRNGWERFENHCRELVGSGKELHIAAGPHGAGGTGGDGPKESFARGGTRVTVPAACWKVVLVLSRSGADPGPDSKMLAVWMPNDTTVPKRWEPYAVSVAEVERRTGYTFFPLVPDAVAGPLKQAGP